MKRIKLINSRKVAHVSDRDFTTAKKYRWSLMKTGYVYSRPKKEEYGLGVRPTYLLHRLVLGFPKMFVDHRDRNKLNCTRRNLRKCTPYQSVSNRGKMKTNTSGFIGVQFNKERGKYQARISYDRRSIYIGAFDCPVKAAKGRDRLAIKFQGKFAVLNFPGGAYL